jgi:hypothetical protein
MLMFENNTCNPSESLEVKITDSAHTHPDGGDASVYFEVSTL